MKGSAVEKPNNRPSPLDQLKAILVNRDLPDFASELRARTRESQEDQTPGTLFENRIWKLLHSLGAAHLNRTKSKLILNEKGKTKQIDVIGRIEDIVFIIECKTSKNPSGSYRKELAETAMMKKSIAEQCRALWGDDIKAVYVYALSGIRLSESDLSDAKEYDIKIWEDETLNYFEDLVNRLGDAAKYQIFAESLGESEIPRYADRVPAIHGQLPDGVEFFSFLARPDSLLKIAYIFHRKLKFGGRYANPYQRMMSKSRIEDIRDYVQSSGYFANNVIANFKKSPNFHLQHTVEGIEYGTLTLPKYYRSLWIIDGQHRLFGFSNTTEAKTQLIPVFAFTGLSDERQGKLFLDINRNQKNVDPNLLWDLYSDLYYESSDDDKRELYAISMIAKKLNMEEGGAFSGHISIPSLTPANSESEANLKMQTICLRLQRGKLIRKSGPKNSSGDLYRENYERSIDFATERISGFFRILMESHPDDWNMGDEGFLRSNVGVNSMFLVFQDILKVWRKYDSGKNPLRNEVAYAEKIKEYLLPFSEYFEKLSKEEKDNLKGGTSEKQFKENARLFCREIHNKIPSFASPLLDNELSSSGMGVILNPNQKIDLIEIEMRKFIHQTLVDSKGPNYWEATVPIDVKASVEIKIMEEIRKFPYKSREDYKSGEQKIEFCYINDYAKIIAVNWPIFKKSFGTVELMTQRFRNFNEYRNRIKHARKDVRIDSIVKNDGEAALSWFAEILDIDLD